MRSCMPRHEAGRRPPRRRCTGGARRCGSCSGSGGSSASPRAIRRSIFDCRRRSSLATRPLTDDEVAMCRWASMATPTETRLPAVWALAEAGATSGEIPFVRCVDVDVDGRHRVARRRDEDRSTRPCRSPIGDSSSFGVASRSLERRTVAPIWSTRDRDRPQSAQASVSGAIGDVLRRAGLGDEPDVRPRSVTAWAGRRSLRARPVRSKTVAQRLGMRSLDRPPR